MELSYFDNLNKVCYDASAAILGILVGVLVLLSFVYYRDDDRNKEKNIHIGMNIAIIAIITINLLMTIFNDGVTYKTSFGENFACFIGGFLCLWGVIVIIRSGNDDILADIRSGKYTIKIPSVTKMMIVVAGVGLIFQNMISKEQTSVTLVMKVMLLVFSIIRVIVVAKYDEYYICSSSNCKNQI